MFGSTRGYKVVVCGARVFAHVARAAIWCNTNIEAQVSAALVPVIRIEMCYHLIWALISSISSPRKY